MARTFKAVFVAIVLSLALAPIANAATTVALVEPLNQPLWAELSPAQRQILAPLAKDWDGMESFRRKKWVGVAQRYPSMSPEQQGRVQAQMKLWAGLSPEERNAAREKFKKSHQSPPEQRDARRQKWEEYKALPEDEKRKFREKAAKRKSPRTSGGKYAPRPLTPKPDAAQKPPIHTPAVAPPATSFAK